MVLEVGVGCGFGVGVGTGFGVGTSSDSPHAVDKFLDTTVVNDQLPSLPLFELVAVAV